MSEKAAIKQVSEQEEFSQKFNTLREAARNLYYAAVWHADRPVNEIELWKALRDAMGFTVRQTPEELPYQGIRAEYSLNRLRLLAEAVRKSAFSTPQMEAFLSLFGDELQGRLDTTIRDFIGEKLG